MDGITNGRQYLQVEMKTESVDYLILAELSSKPLYVLRRLADLRCQTSRVSHLRIFLINIFHLAEGLAE